MVHELKTDPGVFTSAYNGFKPWEIRFDDRNYKVGDMIRSVETEYTGEQMKKGYPLKYTGRDMEGEIDYILTGPAYGLADGWVIMSIKWIPY